MKEINCEIIQDLLPSYSDKISSKSTNELVERHLQKCENCREVLLKMNKDIDIDILNSNDTKIDYLKGYLYSEEYKDMYLTGVAKTEGKDTEIYYKILAKKLPENMDFESDGLDLTFIIDEHIEKIYIVDMKNNKKEIWNKSMKVQTEEEWRKWYIDNYVPHEIKERYNMKYDNIPFDTSIWKHIYNRNL